MECNRKHVRAEYVVPNAEVTVMGVVGQKYKYVPAVEEYNSCQLFISSQTPIKLYAFM